MKEMGSLLDIAPAAQLRPPSEWCGTDRQGLSRISEIQRVVYSTCRSPASLTEPAERWYRSRMTQLTQTLDKKLASWRPEVAAHVEQIVTDVIKLADTDALDLPPSRG